MTPRQWLEFVGCLAALGLFAWVCGVVHFWMVARDARRNESRRASEMAAVLRPLTVLLGLYQDAPVREACSRRAAALQQRLAAGHRQEARARWLVWLRPFHARHLLHQAWARLAHDEEQLAALVELTERRVWRRLPLRVSAPPDSGVEDPLPAQAAAVHSSCRSLAAVIPAVAAGSASEVVALARSSHWFLQLPTDITGADDREATVSALADRAWGCVALSEAIRPGGRALRDQFDRMEHARQRASKPRAAVHANPPRSFQIEFDELTAWMEKADRMHDQAQTMLTHLAFHRAAWFFDEATQHYERRIWIRTGESSGPARPRVAPMTGDATDSSDDGDESADLLDLALAWPGGLDPVGESLPDVVASSLLNGDWSGGGSSLDSGSLLDSISSNDSGSSGSGGWWD